MNLSIHFSNFSIENSWEGEEISMGNIFAEIINSRYMYWNISITPRR